MTVLLLILAGCLVGGTLGVYGLSAWWTHAVIAGNDSLTMAWLVIATIVTLAGAFELFTMFKARHPRP